MMKDHSNMAVNLRDNRETKNKFQIFSYYGYLNVENLTQSLIFYVFYESHLWVTLIKKKINNKKTIADDTLMTTPRVKILTLIF